MGGVTLLLLVTLVLTGSPALGRTADLGAAPGQAGPEHRLTSTQRAEVRAVKRDHARPQIKPAGGAVVASTATTTARRAPIVLKTPVAPAEPAPQTGHVRVALLNLPPPSV